MSSPSLIFCRSCGKKIDGNCEHNRPFCKKCCDDSGLWLSHDDHDKVNEK